jgi:hypothetical protein
MRFFLAALLALLAPALAQQPPQQQNPPRPAPNTPQAITQEVERDLPLPPNAPSKLLKYHHEEVKKDIERLLKLVQDVQSEIDKAGENVLPLGALKKLEEVEKLSKRLRGKIKQ